MGSANAAVVRQVVEAFNTRDADRIAGFVAPGGEADWSRSLAPYRGVYRGPDEWRDWLRLRFDAWRDARWEPLEVTEVDGGRILLVVRLVAAGRDSGIEVSAEAGILWTIRAGKVARAELFQTRAEALAAAGRAA